MARTPSHPVATISSVLLLSFELLQLCLLMQPSSSVVVAASSTNGGLGRNVIEGSEDGPITPTPLADPTYEAQIFLEQQANWIAAANGRVAASSSTSLKDTDAQALYDIEHAALLEILALNPQLASLYEGLDMVATTNHCTAWYGVKCDADGRVNKLEFATLLYGPLAPMAKPLKTFTKLQYLSLGIQPFGRPGAPRLPALTGTLPEDWPSAFPALENMLVYQSNISGTIPGSWGNWQLLQTLRMDQNQLEGQIPSELGKLTNLKQLKMDLNKLGGVIPSELNQLTNLQELWLSSNALTGPIPDLSGLTALKKLYLGSNQLTGTLGPSAWQNMKDLEIFNVASNKLSEQIDGALFSNKPKLQTLYFALNSFSGPLPVLENLPAPQNLYVNGNDFRGGLLAGYGALSNLIKLIADEDPKLGGIVPLAYSNLTKLTDL